MSAPIYSVVSEADVALSAGSPKSVLGVKSGAAFGLLLKEWRVAFDGVAAGAEPVTVQLCYATWATNSPGTNSDSETVRQGAGRTIASGTTAGSNWSAEPTVLTVLEEVLIHPQAGIVMQVPLGDEYDCDPDEGFVIRCTAPATVNARGFLKFSRA